MSDKKGWGRKLCGNCARISKRDLGRRYCPVTASSAAPNKPADDCVFYDREVHGKHGRERDVYEE